MTAALRAQFERLRPAVEAALAVDAERTPDELLQLLLSRHAQIWPSENAFVVTELSISPTGPSIHAWIGGGILTEMMDLRPGIEAWGRAQGATFATIDSRPGWDRLYRRFGYERVEGLLRKRL
jgi:hypothetical protein